MTDALSPVPLEPARMTAFVDQLALGAGTLEAAATAGIDLALAVAMLNQPSVRRRLEIALERYLDTEIVPYALRTVHNALKNQDKTEAGEDKVPLSVKARLALNLLQLQQKRQAAEKDVSRSLDSMTAAELEERARQLREEELTLNPVIEGEFTRK